MPKKITFCFMILITAWPSSVMAEELFSINEQQGIRTQSMGGAYRAVANGNEALHFNPAGLPFFKRFNLDADWIYHTRSQRHWTGMSLSDSLTSSLAAGLDFHVGVNTQKAAALSYLVGLSLAYPLFDIFSLGATIKYAYLPKILSEDVVNQVTGDIGLILKLPFGLSLAAVGYNLIPVQSKRLPLSFGLGAAFSLGSKHSGVATTAAAAYSGLTIAADWLIRDLTAKEKMEHQLSVGAEYCVIDMIPVRLGYNWSIKNNAHRISAGLGLLFRLIEIDILFQQDLTQTQYRSFGAALRFFFL
jgi:hypothetical protein